MKSRAASSGNRYRALQTHMSGPRSGLQWYHNLGRILNELRPVGSAYARGWIRAAAEAVVEPAKSTALSDLYYRALRFAEVFGEDDVEKLANKKLSWEMVRTVFSRVVESRDDAKRLLLEAAANGWSVRELREHIGTARKMAIESVSPDVKKTCASWLRHCSKWSTAIDSLDKQLGKPESAQAERRKAARLLEKSLRDVRDVKKAADELIARIVGQQNTLGHPG